MQKPPHELAHHADPEPDQILSVSLRTFRLIGAGLAVVGLLMAAFCAFS